MYKSKLDKNLLFVAKTRNYDIFVAKIYDYALINSFGGFPGIIDSITSYASLSLDRRALGNSQPFNAYQNLLKVVSKFLRNFYLGRKNLQKIP